MDKDGNIICTNRKFQTRTDGTLSAGKNPSFADFLYPKDFSNYMFLLQKALDTNQPNFLMEIRKIKEDGSDFHWTKWEFSISKNNLGEIFVAAVGHEIQKQNERNVTFPDFIYEYQVKNEIMEGLFEDNLFGYWVSDLVNDKFHMSKSLLNVFGYQHHQDPNRAINWKNHIHPMDIEKVEMNLEDHFNNPDGHPFQCNFRLQTLEGKELWVIGYGKVIKWDQENKPVSMVGCFFDISEKKKFEFLLEKQSQFLKDLTFNQSHLMRSKLTNIIGMLEIIDHSGCSKEISSYINIINAEAKKLDEVLRESINISSALNNQINVA